jgi:hypothetical protein
MKIRNAFSTLQFDKVELSMLVAWSIKQLLTHASKLDLCDFGSSLVCPYKHNQDWIAEDYLQTQWYIVSSVHLTTGV